MLSRGRVSKPSDVWILRRWFAPAASRLEVGAWGLSDLVVEAPTGGEYSLAEFEDSPDNGGII